ncbi:hypothetical protein [Salinarimonas soli]|uniref:Uncharacterized protein n=1 Tax=Salinarimonas soli TaxID=1638099 RepID=A0A5B2VHE5_9HYPH|nr:hypothetical protein [Salinarimonas soli]KAA2238028.1 hypothetical protein F0L46_07085 [Salinarimonas soli]
MSLLCALVMCAAPAVAPKPDFERAVNAPLRAYETCARTRPGAKGCAGHLDAARAGMVGIGYSPAQAASHVGAAQERFIAPRQRGSSDAPAAKALKPASPARKEAARGPGADEHLADWTLCLEKTRGDVLAYPVAPDADVEATASAITRACNGYASLAQGLLVASGQSEAQAKETLAAFTDTARRRVLAELRRRAGKAAPRRDTASASGAVPR